MCVRTLRDVNGRSQAEIIAQSRGRGPETSSSTEDELKPPAWFEVQAHHYDTLKSSLPLMSMEVVDTYFRRFKEYHLSSACAPMVKGTELARTSSDKNTMRYDYVVKNVDTGEARCWWKTTWRSNHDTSVRSTTVITMWRQRDAPTPHGSFRIVSIDRAVCNCVPGVTGWCKHIAAALILFHKLNQKNTAADDLTCISKPCTWLAPPRNAMKKSKEVRNIEFRQLKGDRPHSPAACSCRNADADRVDYQVYGIDVLAEMDEYGTGDLHEAKKDEPEHEEGIVHANDAKVAARCPLRRWAFRLVEQDATITPTFFPPLTHSRKDSNSSGVFQPVNVLHLFSTFHLS